MSAPKPVKAAFKMDGITLPFDRLLPTKQVKSNLKQSTKYAAILASIGEVGVIEPLSVHPHKGGKYLLLDGHVRVEALKELGKTEALCLISTDDEAYTYNHQISPVAPIQATRMILKAIEAGVPEERIARALSVSPHTVHQGRSILEGICAEAIDVLKDKPVARATLREIKRLKPFRQIVVAEIMVTSGNYTASYARGLVGVSPKDSLVEPERPRRASPGLRPEDIGRIEHEMVALEKDFLAVEETYTKNVMDLTIARTYLKKLFNNGKVVRYLAQKHKDVFPELQTIVESTTLEA